MEFVGVCWLFVSWGLMILRVVISYFGRFV